MPFVLVEGTFHARNYTPDGDSLKFKAVNPHTWGKLHGRRVALNPHMHAQLRFEGIDAPETHFEQTHQPLPLADEATDFMLRCAGFGKVVWSRRRRRIIRADDGVPGYVLTRMTDRSGRPVAFVFPGASPHPDGTKHHADADWIERSVNYRMLARGYAYPTFYKSLFPDLRDTLARAVVRAYNADRGVWPYDWSDGFTVESAHTLTREVMIFPKLFRRIMHYLRRHGSLRRFDRFLARKAEPILVIPTAHTTHLDTVVRVEGNRIAMTEAPEDLVFLT